MRTCKQCLKSKKVDQFYLTSGFNCKECTKTAVRKNRAENLTHYREYDHSRNMRKDRVEARKAYAQSEHGRPIIRNIKERWADRNAFKRVAQYTAGNAIRDGRLKRLPCEKCGKKAHAHHDDYTKALDVRWLCPKHHTEHHMSLRKKAA